MEGVGIAIFYAGYALFTYGLGVMVGGCNAPFLSYLNPLASFDCSPDVSSAAAPPTSKPIASTGGGIVFPGNNGQCPEGYVAYKDRYNQIACAPLNVGGPLAPGKHKGGGIGG